MLAQVTHQRQDHPWLFLLRLRVGLAHDRLTCQILLLARTVGGQAQPANSRASRLFPAPPPAFPLQLNYHVRDDLQHIDRSGRLSGQPLPIADLCQNGGVRLTKAEPLTTATATMGLDYMNMHAG